MPLIETKGAASSQGFGQFASTGEAVYIESVFSTYLYTGNDSTQTITNGIDLSGKGGLVWIKSRSSNVAYNHVLTDTARGAGWYLSSNTDYAQVDESSRGITGFNSTGFNIGNWGVINGLTGGIGEFASWTFREQPKFFDVVTYTGNGATGRTIAHNLGSAPGCVIVKKTSGTGGSWAVWHRSATGEMYLDLTSAQDSGGFYTVTAVSSTNFTVSINGSAGNENGATYVAYLFAHNAGGFGLTGSDNVISCGSYTGNGSTTGPTINLGWEPQFVMAKASSTTGGWFMVDTMRGQGASGSSSQQLEANTSGSESFSNFIAINSTGFQLTASVVDKNGSGQTYIYIAIRRGPMKVPTTGTSVFGLSARSGTGADATVTGGQIDDAVLIKNRGSAVGDLFAARLTGTGYLETSSTAAEVAAGTTILQANPWDVMDGVKVGTTSTITNASSNTFINYLFRRAPSFMDVVCYTGTGSATTVSHNLTVAPELMIVKRRNSTGFWAVYSSTLGAANVLELQSTAASTSGSAWNSTAPTASVFTVGNTIATGASGGTYVAYLFASCPGVSKVGSYTGTGTTLQIDCGFTAGARFVLIKRTDSTGDWYVWDSARGIVAGNDPYLLLNSTAAEVTTTDWVDTYSAGFELSSAAGNNVNINTASYIFLSIA